MEHLSRIFLHLRSVDGKSFTAAQIASFGPLLQGVLMENIDGAYAEQLHASTFNPYSQNATLGDNGEVIWVLNALNDEAAERIVGPLSKVDAISIRGLGESFAVEKRVEESTPISALLGKIKDDCRSRHRIRFTTPTAFKVRGEYVMMPTTKLLFQNLLMHYNQVYAGSAEVDEDTLAYIDESTRISSYNLRSQYFSRVVNGKKIPAFIGDITLSISGSQPMQGLAGMLLGFGEYAGVGIKTSMGMGGMRERRENA